jgi:hypothetical protein
MSTISGISPSASLSNALGSGRAAIAGSSQRLDQDAQQIANPNNNASSTNALLDSGQSLVLAQAGASVIGTSDQMLGTLLNMFA